MQIWFNLPQEFLHYYIALLVALMIFRNIYGQPERIQFQLR